MKTRNVMLIGFALVLLLLVFPQPALALGAQTEPPLQLPTEVTMFIRVLILALASWLTYQIVEGAKKYVPWLEGSAAQFAAVITAALLSSFDQLILIVNNLLAGVTDPMLILLLKTVFFALIAWIGSQGVFRSEKKKQVINVSSELVELPVERVGRL